MHSPHGHARSRSSIRNKNRSRSNSGSRSNSAKKREQAATANLILIHRLSAEADATELAAEQAANEDLLADDKRKKFGAPEHKAAIETFHVIEPPKRERRWSVYSGKN